MLPLLDLATPTRERPRPRFLSCAFHLYLPHLWSSSTNPVVVMTTTSTCTIRGGQDAGFHPPMSTIHALPQGRNIDGVEARVLLGAGDGGFRRRRGRTRRGSVRVGPLGGGRKGISSHLEGICAMSCRQGSTTAGGVGKQETLHLRRAATTAQGAVRRRLRAASWDAILASGARMRGCGH